MPDDMCVGNHAIAAHFNYWDSLSSSAPIFGEDNAFKRILIEKGDAKSALTRRHTSSSPCIASAI